MGLSEYFPSTTDVAAAISEITPSLRCTCDPLSDEHCDICRNRHKLSGVPYLPYEKTDTVLSIEDIDLNFQGKAVLRNVDVKIRRIIVNGKPRMRVVAFLGPSGIGKTQLIRVMTGLQPPSAGNVFLTEKRIPTSPGFCGLVMQQYPLFRNRTVISNLMAAAQHNGGNHKTYYEKCVALLKRFNMEDKANLYPSQLSGGQRQRIAVAQQLLCSEKYLFMDEPTAGLDPVSKKKVGALITDIANEGDGIIIIVTHDIPTAVSLADTIWLMGRERDAEGNVIPGARIIDTYDLIECGLAWNPSNTHPAYNPLVQELNDRFASLLG